MAQAKAKLKRAGCKLGKVSKPRRVRGRKPVVKRSFPRAGATTSRGVKLQLGPKPTRKRH